VTDIDSPEYPVGCMIVSDSPDVDREIGVVLETVVGAWEYRQVLWLDGRVSLEGIIYLGTFYRAVSFVPTRDN
jgi:hypothetical protein